MPTMLVPPRPMVPVDDVTRREVLIGAGAGLLLAACGARQAETTAPTTTEAGGVFPVTIAHKFGSTEIPTGPQRVVSVGFTDHDFVLALGITPVAVRDFYGDQPYATWPWARDALDDAEPDVLASSELDFEQIAGLRPDLIIALYSGITEGDYATLSKIAPTLAQSGDHPDYRMPWQDKTRVVGRALGKEERAEELVDELEARFADVRTAHPEFADLTAVSAQLGDSGVYYPGAPDTTRGRILTSLGFRYPDEVAELFDRGVEEISAEQLHLLDHDVLLWDGGGYPELVAAIKDNPVFQQLDVSREGRVLFLDDPVELTPATQWATVLSLPFVLDELVPQLVAAADGDPATTAEGGA